MDTAEGSTTLAPKLPIESEDASGSLSLVDVPIVGASHRTLEQEEPGTDGDVETPVVASEEAVAIGEVKPGEKRGRLVDQWWLVIVLVLMTGLVIGLTLGLTLGRNSSSGSSPSSTDTNAHMSRNHTDEDIPRPKVEDIANYLVNQGVVSPAAMTKGRSIQFLAAKWMAERDEARIALPTVSIGDAQDRSGYRYMARFVMVLNYIALNGPQWLYQLNFMTQDDICEWNGLKQGVSQSGLLEPAGVKCDESGLPKILYLEFNNLQGQIPTENGLLTTLLAFDVSYNVNIGGIIPTELCQLTDLMLLAIGANSFQGPIPACLGHWSQLQGLILEVNSLTGELPSELCLLTNLRGFIAQRNHLNGTIPGCIGNWTKLESFIISENYFSGELPTELMLLSNSMVEFFVDNNDFEGDPTSTINQLSNLQMLYLENNMFSGTIDENFVKGFLNLTVLDISNNTFQTDEYAVPTHFFELPNLAILDISKNALSGKLPEDIPLNSNLLFFSVQNNIIQGQLPTQLGNLQALRRLDLSTNQFNGTMPTELFSLTNLENLYMMDNVLMDSGPIPGELETMTQLVELSLRNTNRNGKLPELLDFFVLQLLDFGSNDLTGTIPPNYGKLLFLQHLLLNKNLIGGNMPEFTNLWLRTILVDGTSVTGNFSSICALPAFTTYDFPGEEIAIADCDGTDGPDSRIYCTCCMCCVRNKTDSTQDQQIARYGCSDPVIADLDWTWELRGQQDVKDFHINKTLLSHSDDK